MKYHNTDALIQSSINHFSQLPSGYFPLNAKEVLHYLDQSHRDERLKNHETAIVCVHGNPSWSWYFRHYFTPHQKLRVIAVDHLGMGFSSKVDRHVTIEEHANNLNKLLDHLNIRKVHLVVHDWGGVIGLLALKKSSRDLVSLIGMNTAFFPRQNFPWRIYLTTRPLWNSFLNKKLGVFSKAASYMTTHNNLETSMRMSYLFPYRFQDDRQGIVNFLKEIPWFQHSPRFALMKECETYIKSLSIPMMAIWGLKDFCFDESYLKYWKKICPHLKVEKFFDAGHWCFEDKTKEIAELSEKFWATL